MITAQFQVERSNFGTYLRMHTYSCSLINFLSRLKMLKDKYKVLATPNTKRKSTVLCIPNELAHKMPFILTAATCRQLNNCIHNPNDLKLIKFRLKNYYCEDFFKKLVSVFGNDKAWNKFEINTQWKPKLEFVGSKHLRTEPSTPYFNFTTYKLCSQRCRIITKPYRKFRAKRLVEVYWNDDKTVRLNKKVSWHSSVLSRINVSKSRISRVINNPNKKAIEDFKETIEIINANQKLLTKDGLELQKDLNLIRALVL